MSYLISFASVDLGVAVLISLECLLMLVDIPQVPYSGLLEIGLQCAVYPDTGDDVNPASPNTYDTTIAPSVLVYKVMRGDGFILAFLEPRKRFL